MVTTHFPPYHLGGDAVYVKYLSEELAAKGHEVHIFHSPSAYQAIRGDMKPSKLEQVDDRITRHEVTSRSPRLDTVASLTLGTRNRAKTRFDELTKTLRPDIVHWHNTKGFIGIPLPTGRASSIYTAHDYYAVCTRSNLLKPHGRPCVEPHGCLICNLRHGKPTPIWRAGRRRVLPMPTETKVIAPSHFMANRLGRDGIRVSKVIRNFVPDPGPPNLDSAAYRNLVLYVGLLEPHKGPQTLLKAFLLSRNEHDFRLCLVGDGTLRQTLALEAKDAGVADRVSVPGPVSRDELHSLRRGALVQVIPSEWYENSPLTALEALAAGIPLVGSRIGGLPEILTPDSGASAFAPGDARDLANILRSLSEKRGKMNATRRAARRAYETSFTPRSHIEAYLDEISTT